VPMLAILAAATHVREREPAALLQPPRILRVPCGENAQFETSIAGHQQPLRPVLLQPLLAGNEHGNAGAVLRLEKDLLDLILAGVEGNLGLEKYLPLPGHPIQT